MIIFATSINAHDTGQQRTSINKESIGALRSLNGGYITSIQKNLNTRTEIIELAVDINEYPNACIVWLRMEFVVAIK